jgi:hypothetical protein
MAHSIAPVQTGPHATAQQPNIHEGFQAFCLQKAYGYCARAKKENSAKPVIPAKAGISW